MECKNRLCFFLVLSLMFNVQAEDLVYCLSAGGVNNFTSYYTTTYRHLLHLSIQNLRYAKPSVNKPVALILPENIQEVATAIQCSRKGSWLIRLRSGGHSFEGLSSYADTPFVLIDLMHLNKVSVDLESETAWVEGGATVGEIYHAIATSSKRHAFPAGMCPTVGSGGHISGGGYGALVRKYGLAADNVVDVILVDAEGRVLDRNSMGNEVFWAIRGGGGGNWGAVVAWKIRLVEVPETVTAFRIFKSGSTQDMAKFWDKWQSIAPKLEDDFFLQSLVFSGANQSQPPQVSMFFMGLYLGPKGSSLTSITSSFPELKLTLQDCQEMGWAEAIIFLRGDFKAVQSINDLKNRHSYRKTFTKAKSDFVNSPIPLASLEGAMQLVAELPKAYLLLDPYGGFMERMKSDTSPFPYRAGTLYGIEYYVDWSEEEDGRSDEYFEGIRRLYDYMTPLVTKNPRGVYVNNVDLDLGVMEWRTEDDMSGDDGVKVGRVWGEKYFKGNYDRLVQAKTAIDPRNVFRHPQSVPPATALGFTLTKKGSLAQ